MQEAVDVLKAIREAPFNIGSEIVHPQSPGLVVRQENGKRILSSMTWGFPLVLKGAKGQPLKPRPVNNARTDKLGTPFWRRAFENRRCLIPLTQSVEELPR